MIYMIMRGLFVLANHDFVSLSFRSFLVSASLIVPALAPMFHLMQLFKLCQTSSHTTMKSSCAMEVHSSGLHLTIPMDRGVMLLLVK